MEYSHLFQDNEIQDAMETYASIQEAMRLYGGVMGFESIPWTPSTGSSNIPLDFTNSSTEAYPYAKYTCNLSRDF